MAEAYISERQDFSFLNCKICKHLYSVPKILPCLHSFCTSCIDAKLDDEKKITCPECEEQFDSFGQGSAWFHTAYFLQNWVHSYKLKTEEYTSCTFCELQGKVRQAENLCLECRDGLCSICSEKHNLTRLTINHRLLSLAKLRSGNCENEIGLVHKLQCEEHEGELIKLYCVDCSKPLCCDCLIQHKRHAHITTEEAYKGVEKECTEFQTALKVKVEYIRSCHSNIDKEITSLDNTEKHLVDTVDVNAEKLISKIKADTRKAKCTIKEEARNKKIKLIAIKADLHQRLLTINTPLNLVQSITARRTFGEVLYFRKFFNRKHETLNKLRFEMPKIERLMLSVQLAGCITQHDSFISIINTATNQQTNKANSEKQVNKKTEFQHQQMAEHFQRNMRVNEEHNKMQIASGGHNLRNECCVIACEEKSDNKNVVMNPEKNILKVKTNDASEGNIVNPSREENPSIDADDSFSCMNQVLNAPEKKSEFDKPFIAEASTIKLKIHTNFNSKLSCDVYLPNITDVAWLSSSIIVVADDKNTKIKVFDVKRKIVCVEGGYSANNVAVSRDNILCSCSDGIHIYNKSLNDKKKNIYFSDSKNTTQFACTDQNVIVSRSNWPRELRVYTHDGKRDRDIVSNHSFNAKYIVINSKEQIILSDEISCEVVLLEPNGTRKHSYKSKPKASWKPCGVFIDNYDNVYVADSVNNAILKLSPDLKKANVVSTQPYFCHPHAISWKDEHLAISDGTGCIWICRLIEECILIKPLKDN